MEITVTGYALVRGHIEYSILLEDCGIKARKRYRELLAFHRSLQDMHGTQTALSTQKQLRVLPPFPKKLPFGSFSQKLAAVRATELRAYFDALVRLDLPEVELEVYRLFDTPGPTIVDISALSSQGADIALASRYNVSCRLEDDVVLQRRVLGEGASGDVQLGKWRSTGATCAVKSLSKRNLDPLKRVAVKNEAEIYLTLDHPHIARLDRVYETLDHVHLVMEHLEGGELFDHVARGALPEAEAARALGQMLDALVYLHARGVAHCDLKPENFLYERAGDYSCLKLIDFGLAQRCDGQTPLSHVCGTLGYVAPEVLAGSYGIEADIWSIGVVAYVLLTGRMPSRTLTFPSSMSAGAQQFVAALLSSDPSARPSAAVALTNPFLLLWAGRDGQPTPVALGRAVCSHGEPSHVHPAQSAWLLFKKAWSLRSDVSVDFAEYLRDAREHLLSPCLPNFAGLF